VGQPIAFVIAETPLLAQDASELAVIEFEPHDAVPDVQSALKPGATQIHPDVSGNLSADFEAGDEKAVDEAFAKAAFVSRITVKSQRLVGNPMEPRAVTAYYDKEQDRYTVHSPTQGIHGMQNFLGQATNLSVEQMKIEIQNVGGSFGLRVGPYSEHVGAVIASKVLGKAIKWVGTRSEVFLSDWQGRALTLNASVALDKEGHILAFKYHDYTDLGAYTSYMSSFIGTRNLSVTMGGVYKVPALYMRSDLVFTNTTPISAYRGAGRPDIAYTIERMIDFAAHEHGFDPIELRRKNYIKPSEFPYLTANGTTYDKCDFERLLNRALELSDYNNFSRRLLVSKEAGKLRGIGLSSVLESSAAGNVQKDQVEGQFNEKGVLTIYGVTGASGQGHATSFAQIVEHELGLSTEHVVYLASVAGTKLIGNGTGGSRTLYGAGSAIKDLCIKLRNIIQTMLALKWHKSAEDIEFKNAHWSCKSDASLSASTQEVIKLFNTNELLSLQALGETSSGATFPNGCHVAEVEIDPLTGEIEVLNYTAVDDLGKVISPTLVRGQVHGGVLQGLGQALMEEVVYDAQGQLLTGSFMDYAMPRAGALMRLHNETVEVETTLNLLGSKGVGESGCTASLPALANAVMSALRPLGIDQMDMPFTPYKVWSAIHAAQKS